ncbi:MAG: GNAT family N-acetyltransferase [Caulobacterales bacterium]|nr:GNAT family N-acetyltransferase [Caulobacterales bacterium]
MCVIETTPTIETRRLTLRAPRIEDAPRLARLCNDPDIARMTATMPTPYALEDAEAFIDRCAAADPRKHAPFVIELDGDGVVGGLGFHTKSDGPIEVGYWIGAPFQGRGIASEALVGAMAWAGRDWRRRVVAAGHFSDNPASGVVLCRAGFLYTGEVVMQTSLGRPTPAPSRRMIWLP